MERIITKSFARLMGRGTHRGFITYEELSKSLGKRNLSDENLAQAFIHILNENISLVEKKSDFKALRKKENTSKDENKTIEKSDDPIRMYLREMGGVELLSREGEIAIAKRIEAGRELMIGGIAESPLTIKAVVQWRDMLKAEEVLLRDVIDLDSTYAATPEAQALAAKSAAAASNTAARLSDGTVDNVSDEEEEEEEEDLEENNMSLAALEASLMPQVMENLDAIKIVFGKLQKVQDRRLARMFKGEALTAQSEQRYAKLKDELVELMDGVRLNNSRLEALPPVHLFEQS